jgi:hypothetical protein
MDAVVLDECARAEIARLQCTEPTGLAAKSSRVTLGIPLGTSSAPRWLTRTSVRLMIASTKRRGANVSRKYVGFADARDTLSRDG